MATKNNPGAFKCYEAALPDEEFFTALARDLAAPATVDFWCDERERLGLVKTEDDRNRINEARRVAQQMRLWRAKAVLDATANNEEPIWRQKRQIMDDGPPVCIGEIADPITIKAALHELLKLEGEDFDSRSDRVKKIKLIGKMIDAIEANTEYVMTPFEVGPDDEQTLDDRGQLGGPTYDRPIRANPALGEGYGKSPVAEDTGKDVYEQFAEQILDTAPEDLAHAPEVPPHRFSTFVKYGGWAYARGLEVNPSHLPRALEAMSKDGWEMVAVFGQTDSQNIGFIFRRLPEVDHGLAEALRVFRESYPAPPSVRSDFFAALRKNETTVAKSEDKFRGDYSAPPIDLGRQQEP